MSAKRRSLEREYEQLCERAGETRWYSLVQHDLNFDDWLQVDAMYRSRALDFPGIGHCMVPCLDLANHSSGDDTVAVYERDNDGNAVLLLRDGKSLEVGDEVTITYGDEKGACEMLFSYGFLEDDMKTAEMLFLQLTIPDVDTYKTAKMQIADCAPGFKLNDAGDGQITWEGDFIWLLCLYEDDGLRFELVRTVDGDDEEMHAFFEDHEIIGGAAELHGLLSKHDLWDVYRGRAVIILQERVSDQMQWLLNTTEDVESMPHGEGSNVSEHVFEQAVLLRRLELRLLEQAYEYFEHEVSDAASCV